ncbi:barttin [Takifugu flavidus]|uniref:barttin n=1 Tax=Takifugu flavidus TaxID=433684 RepID=UPI0025442E2F|nr:barttin [Takifugu flavidus]
MVEGKPYRYGLIAAGLCVAAVGLFIMTRERPHVYITFCALGVSMMCAGTVWSACQCYPKVPLVATFQEECQQDAEAAETKHKRYTEALLVSCEKSWSSGLSETTKTQFHSCPTLQLV